MLQAEAWPLDQIGSAPAIDRGTRDAAHHAFSSGMRQGFDENCGRDVKADQHGQRDDLAREKLAVAVRRKSHPRPVERLPATVSAIFERGSFAFALNAVLLRPAPDLGDLLFGHASCTGQRYVARPVVVAIDTCAVRKIDDFGERARKYRIVAKCHRHVARRLHQRRRIRHHPVQIENAASGGELRELFARERIVGRFDQRQRRGGIGFASSWNHQELAGARARLRARDGRRPLLRAGRCGKSFCFSRPSRHPGENLVGAGAQFADGRRCNGRARCV